MSFKCCGFAFIGKGVVTDYPSGAKFLGVRGFAGVVLGKAPFDVDREADVELVGMGHALKEVDYFMGRPQGVPSPREVMH